MARRDMAAYIQKNMTISFLPTAVYLLRMCKIIMAVMMMATMCTKHVAVGWLGCIHRSYMKKQRKRTRLEYKGPSDIDVSAVTYGFDALRCTDERADDEGRILADGVE